MRNFPSLHLVFFLSSFRYCYSITSEVISHVFFILILAVFMNARSIDQVILMMSVLVLVFRACAISPIESLTNELVHKQNSSIWTLSGYERDEMKMKERKKKTMTMTLDREHTQLLYRHWPLLFHCTLLPSERLCSPIPIPLYLETSISCSHLSHLFPIFHSSFLSASVNTPTLNRPFTTKIARYRNDIQQL